MARGDGSQSGEAAEQRAVALLARRPHTEAELRRALAAAGFPDEAIEATLARLRDRGYVGDHALAVQYIVSRAERLGHAPARLAAELRARGVSEEVLREAEREARELHGIDALQLVRREVGRRGAGRGADPRRNARVYNALLRAGYEADLLRAVLGIGPASDDGAGETPAGRWRAPRSSEDESEP